MAHTRNNDKKKWKRETVERKKEVEKKVKE
jgi:hypothetical protein